MVKYFTPKLYLLFHQSENVSHLRINLTTLLQEMCFGNVWKTLLRPSVSKADLSLGWHWQRSLCKYTIREKMFFSFLNSHPIHSNYVNLMSFFAGRHFTKHIWEVKLVIYHPTESNSWQTMKWFRKRKINVSLLLTFPFHPHR